MIQLRRVCPEHPSPGRHNAVMDISRRQLLASAAGLACAVGTVVLAQQESPVDPTTVPGGAPADELGERLAVSEMLTRMPFGDFPHGALASLTPHGDLEGTFTPSDLHYEVTHHGIPEIDPASYKLLVHGMVDRPMSFTLDQLKRFLRKTRINFMECSGNSLFHKLGPSEGDAAQLLSGLSSCSER